jgi:hypothetical protein
MEYLLFGSIYQVNLSNEFIFAIVWLAIESLILVRIPSFLVFRVIGQIARGKFSYDYTSKLSELFVFVHYQWSQDPNNLFLFSYSKLPHDLIFNLVINGE